MLIIDAALRKLLSLAYGVPSISTLLISDPYFASKFLDSQHNISPAAESPK